MSLGTPWVFCFVFCFLFCVLQVAVIQWSRHSKPICEIWLFFLNLITCLERLFGKKNYRSIFCVFCFVLFLRNHKKVWSSLKAVVELVWASEHGVCHHVIRSQTSTSLCKAWAADWRHVREFPPWSVIK